MKNCYTFCPTLDLDALAARPAGRPFATPAALSRGADGAQPGAPRIADLLAGCAQA